MTITPDTKNWTWVLERPCPECGFAAGAGSRDEVPALLRANAEAWRAYFAQNDPEHVRMRPDPDKWSPLEYACHVRDCNKIYSLRVGLMLEEDDPQYPNWDQDSTAVEDKYNEQDPDTVIAELIDTTEQVATRFASVSADQWKRTGHRGDGSDFTVESLARYFAHDPIHHLWDVTGKRHDS
ncbi:DinB family protein [Catenulispora pinisilvae]|uniref:DinB family protein n=1 Tax=Catenulispora pinisilvae TaxID=2705253 RepID=UPI001891B9CB|nr:DinB family protein [Catenulispora pinisilvae]